jgi:hypothetical protein
MKIAAVTPYKKLDYLAETVIEGIYKNGIELKCSCPGNGVSEKDVLLPGDLIEYAKTADYVFAIWGKQKGIYPGIDYNLVKQINQPHKTVYIDGSEWNCFAQTYPNQVTMAKQNPKLRRGKPWIHKDMYDYCKWYFKRECYPEDKKKGIIPLLFGAVDKNFNEYELLEDKTIDIFCSFGQFNDGLRSDALQICKKLKNEGYNVVTEGTFNYETFKNYILSSYISIDAWGGGDCCARLWEILANKSCAFMQEYNIEFPNSFTNDKNIIKYSTSEELENKLRYYLNNKDKCLKIGEEGYKHLMKYHTSKKRVEYILNKINE